MGSSLSYGPPLGPNIVRHPYKKHTKKDPTLENYPYDILQYEIKAGEAASFGVRIIEPELLMNLGFRV